MPAAFAADFVTGLRWEEIPARARETCHALVRDLAAVCAAGRATSTAAIAAQLVRSEHPGDQATLLVDGSRATCTGAAFANGVLANALDFDDGHRVARGHPGAIVIPATLAAAELTGASSRDALSAIVIGYEIAIRAGVDLHARDGGHVHASGAWGALGAAAAAARLLHLDATGMNHALGLAEYHSPRALIKRSVGAPAMTKDACAWGALVGVHAALLAQHGFTALPAAPTTAADVFDDLGERWRILEIYVKPFPCCRWSQPAVQAVLKLYGEHRVDARRISRVQIRTFAAALELATGVPKSGEEAQYSLTWPVAVALARGRFEVDDVLAIDSGAPESLVLAVHDRIEAIVEAQYEQAFPNRRLSEVVVVLDDGHELRSGAIEAPGEPEDPGWRDLVDTKVKRYAPGLDDAHAGGKPRGADRPTPWQRLLAEPR